MDEMRAYVISELKNLRINPTHQDYTEDYSLIDPDTTYHEVNIPIPGATIAIGDVGKIGSTYRKVAYVHIKTSLEDLPFSDRYEILDFTTRRKFKRALSRGMNSVLLHKDRILPR
ncbi:MAG: hypothetical protein JW727_01895 [Candidatus Aenigmarchaeota archaeon]|nr:hypothetical protein [Candidatus Aenigmarchaeota archaeon]